MATTSVERRCHFGAQARRQLLDRIVAGGERSLSMLQGILVLLTWFHVLPAADRQFAALLSQLSVAVAWDLGLTMPPPLEPRVPGCGTGSGTVGSETETSSGSSSGSGSGLTAPPYRTAPPIPSCVMLPYKRERTTEERRTVLAVFSATSSVPLMPDGLRWSPYLEDCLAHLQQAQQTAQDAVLVRHVRLRLLGSQMRHETAWSNAAAASSSSSSTGRGGLVPAVPANLPPTFTESAQLYLDSIIDDPSCLDNCKYKQRSPSTLCSMSWLTITPPLPSPPSHDPQSLPLHPPHHPRVGPHASSPPWRHPRPPPARRLPALPRIGAPHL